MNGIRKYVIKKLSEPLLEKLKEIPLFSCLSEQELSEVEKITSEETFLKNNVIIREADNTTALYVMVSGKAVATGSDEDGKQIIFNVFRKGNYFGEMSFIDKEPRCATVTAGTKIVVLRISGEKLRNIADQYESDCLLNSALCGKAEIVHNLSLSILCFIPHYHQQFHLS